MTDEDKNGRIAEMLPGRVWCRCLSVTAGVDGNWWCEKGGGWLWLYASGSEVKG